MFSKLEELVGTTVSAPIKKAKIHINADKGWEDVGVALLAWK